MEYPEEPDSGASRFVEELYSKSDIGILYESYVASLLIHAGYMVHATPRTGDMGADLLVYHPQDAVRPFWCVQCKYWSQPIRPNAVQEVFTASHLYNAQHAVLVTNAELTPQARAMTDQLGVYVIAVTSSAWSDGTFLVPRPDEIELAVGSKDAMQLGEAWRDFADALAKPENLYEAPWLWITAHRKEARDAAKAVEDLAPHGAKVVSGEALQRPPRLAEVLTALDPGQVLLIQNAERIPADVWEMLLPAVESFWLDIVSGEGEHARGLRIDLPKFGIALMIARPMQLPKTAVGQILRTTATELLRYHGRVQTVREAALAAVKQKSAGQGMQSYKVQGVIPAKVGGSDAYRCSIVTEWRAPEQRGSFGVLIKPSESGTVVWNVLVDAETNSVISVETTKKP